MNSCIFCTNNKVCINSVQELKNPYEFALLMLDAYFTPVPDIVFEGEKFEKSSIGGKIQTYRNTFPKITKAQLAIIGVGDQANKTRKELYKLSWRFDKLQLVDLGNFTEPEETQQRHFAVSEAIGELLALNIIVIILSDEKSHLASHFHGFRDLTKSLEIVMVNEGIDLSENSECFQILKHPEYSKRVSNIDFLGTQAYNITPETLDKMDRFNFENYRLGNIRSDIEETEPVLRSSDMMFFNLSSIRYSDAPDVMNPSPNGLYAEEAATISRYAGLSNVLKSVTFYGMNNHRSMNIGDKLIAQLVWYFIDGVNSRYHDHPSKNDSNYLIYRNRLENTGHEITFYKSRKSDRWWMEVPHPYENETFFIGCSYNDYQRVCNGEMPDRWWRAYQRNLR